MNTERHYNTSLREKHCSARLSYTFLPEITSVLLENKVKCFKKIPQTNIMNLKQAEYFLKIVVLEKINCFLLMHLETSYQG